MRTDVKVLIAALTTERNSLDRAIAALQSITPETSTAPKPERAIRHRRYGGRTVISADTKAALVSQMAQAPQRDKYRRAGQLAREYGLKQKTVATSWTRWQREAEQNGNVTPVLAEA